MARHHVMTAKRKVALRKAQLVSARKRRSRGRQFIYNRKQNIKNVPARYRSLSPRTKKTLKYAAVGAGVAGAFVAQDRIRNVRLYHNTPNRNIPSIKAHGMKGGQYSPFALVAVFPGEVYVTKGINTTRKFGAGTVKIKMNRRKFNKVAIRDEKMYRRRRAFIIDVKDLQGAKVRTRIGGPIRRRISHHG